MLFRSGRCLNPDQTQEATRDHTVTISINEERSWESFANDRVAVFETKGYTFATVSCESFHDGIHLLIGTGKDHKDQSLLPEELRSSSTGHMGNPNYAAVSVYLIISRCS